MIMKLNLAVLLSFLCSALGFFAFFKETSQREDWSKSLLEKWFLQNGLFRQWREERDFKIWQRDGNENVKEIGLEGKTTNLHVHHTFL